MMYILENYYYIPFAAFTFMTLKFFSKKDWPIISLIYFILSIYLCTGLKYLYQSVHSKTRSAGTRATPQFFTVLAFHCFQKGTFPVWRVLSNADGIFKSHGSSPRATQMPLATLTATELS